MKEEKIENKYNNINDSENIEYEKTVIIKEINSYLILKMLK